MGWHSVLRRYVWGLPSPLSFEVHDHTFFLSRAVNRNIGWAAALPGLPWLDHNQRDRQMQNGARYPSLHGQGVFITGGATGIGAALVRAFNEQGARVTFADLNLEAGSALVEELSGA